jgi:hypothetical protein
MELYIYIYIYNISDKTEKQVIEEGRKLGRFCRGLVCLFITDSDFGGGVIWWVNHCLYVANQLFILI